MKRIGVILALVVSSMAACVPKDIQAIQINPVGFSGLKDGVYEGEYSTKLVKAKVSVTVQDGKVAEIKILRHNSGPPGKKANVITQRIVDKQSLEVDAISGATGSSKVILKAVETALAQAQAEK